MLYLFKFLLYSLYFLSSLQLTFEATFENASSVSKEKVLVKKDKEEPIYMNAGGYRPTEHSLAKYVVSIRDKNKVNSEHFGSAHYCGGAILNAELILTAAHCLQLNKRTFRPSSLEVVTGTPTRLVRTTHTQVIEVQKVIVHPKFNEHVKNFDIGLLQLKTKIDLDGTSAQALPLPTAAPVIGETCMSLGWGRIFMDGPYANNILYVNVTIVHDDICRARIHMFTESEICAFDPRDGSKDTCQGDSGAPLICNGMVTGVVSYGHGCGTGIPAVYTEVYDFVDWLSKSKCGKAGASLGMLWFLSFMQTTAF